MVVFMVLAISGEVYYDHAPTGSRHNFANIDIDLERYLTIRWAANV